MHGDVTNELNDDARGVGDNSLFCQAAFTVLLRYVVYLLLWTWLFLQNIDRHFTQGAPWSPSGCITQTVQPKKMDENGKESHIARQKT